LNESFHLATAKVEFGTGQRGKQRGIQKWKGKGLFQTKDPISRGKLPKIDSQRKVRCTLFMGGESGKVWFAELVLGGTFLRRFGKPITQSYPQVLVLNGPIPTIYI
jgi:hypothetical protein